MMRILPLDDEFSETIVAVRSIRFKNMMERMMT